MKISYGITVCDEVEEIYNLLDYLYSNIDDNDEIIILRDMGKTTDAVTRVINQQIDLYKPNQVKVVKSSLNGDFATFKNNLIKHATGDYLFQIDADEMPNQFLIDNIKPILKINPGIDCLYVPRVNKVNGLTPQHVQKWGWKVDDQQRINFPDPQMRIFKLGTGIKWKNKVHEVLEGQSNFNILPYDTEDFCLYHIKSIEKQEKQNNFYDTL